jgi:hypothetical protein
MTRGIAIACLFLALAAGPVPGGDAPPATQPPTAAPATTQPAARPLDAHRYLDHGSWIVTEARVRSNGTPTTIRRKVLITTDAAGRRTLEESRWRNDAFEPDSPALPLAPPDRRSFDELGLAPQPAQADQALTLGRKRYLCSVTTYVVKDDAGNRTTTLTLYRDKSGGTQLPPRTMGVNNRELPLPADCLQVDFAVEGPKVSTRGQRRIVSLSSALRIKGQTCACLVEETRSQGTSNDLPLALAVQEWHCHDLPGERLRTVTEMTAGNMQVASDVTVIDFHVARQDAGPAPAAAHPPAAH